MGELKLFENRANFIEEDKEPEFKDGDGGGGDDSLKITIRCVDNGFTLKATDGINTIREIYEDNMELLARIQELLTYE